MQRSTSGTGVTAEITPPAPDDRPQLFQPAADFALDAGLAGSVQSTSTHSSAGYRCGTTPSGPSYEYL